MRESLLKSLPTSLSTTTGLLLALNYIILSQTYSKLRNDSIEDSEVHNRLEKKDFGDLAKNAKSVAGISPSRQFRAGRE